MKQLLSAGLFIALVILKWKGEIPARLSFFFLPAISFSLAYPITFLAIRLGNKFKMVDDPDNLRKIHKEPTPLTGGLAIVISFAATILYNFHFSWEMKGILIGSGIVFIAGFLDDIFELSAKIRLGMQVLASAVLIYFDVRITFVPDWLGGVVTESLITVIWMVGITNSMNFLDGMDGLASGISIITAFFFAIFAVRTQQAYLAFLCLALIGSCFGFFAYNFRAKQNAVCFPGRRGKQFPRVFSCRCRNNGRLGKRQPG